jgi:hypothetical protein
MNNDTTPITADEADMVIFALRLAADEEVKTGEMMIENTTLRELGFRHFDTANEFRALADRLDMIFPSEEEDDDYEEDDR